MRLIGLVKKVLTSCVEKAKCARYFVETLHVKKLSGRSFFSSTSRRARMIEWLEAHDAAHRACPIA